MFNKLSAELLEDEYINNPYMFFTYSKHLSPWDESLNLKEGSKTQVVTCFLQKGDKILVLQRGKKDAQYGLWGIPGGKLDSSEQALTGLGREIFEETGAFISESNFTHLGSVCSQTSTDGSYGLHLYHAKFPEDSKLPLINQKEHLSYQWVNIGEFSKLNLLHAQGEAFLFVYKKLLNILSNNS